MISDQDRQRQGNILSSARRYGRRNPILFESFVRRAAAISPLSDNQWFNLQSKAGSEIVEKIREEIDASKSLL